LRIIIVSQNQTQSTSKRVWLTFSGKVMVETPALWRMARQFPDVCFDIRQASVTAEIGIMAVLFKGEASQVVGALAFLREQGVAVDPIEGSVVEG
jgi:hypothetical protein